jgi:hypothetical protein
VALIRAGILLLKFIVVSLLISLFLRLLVGLDSCVAICRFEQPRRFAVSCGLYPKWEEREKRLRLEFDRGKVIASTADLHGQVAIASQVLNFIFLSVTVS